MSSPLPGTAPPGPLLPAGIPRIVGIVNITEDSFSDGGRYLDPAAAVAHARNLRADGADIIELGPAASHPDSAPVSAAEEQRRLAPVLEQLAADGIPVSVDSFRTETLRFAVSAGAACLNDIHGFGDPGLYPLLAASQCRLVVMHAVQATGAATRVVTDPAAVRDGIVPVLRPAAGRAAGGRHRPGAARHRPRTRLLPGQYPRSVAGGPGRDPGAEGHLRRARPGVAVAQVLPARAHRQGRHPVRAGDARRGDLRRLAGRRLHPHPRCRRRPRRAHFLAAVSSNARAVRGYLDGVTRER